MRGKNAEKQKHSEGRKQVERPRTTANQTKKNTEGEVEMGDVGMAEKGPGLLFTQTLRSYEKMSFASERKSNNFRSSGPQERAHNHP